MFGGAHFNRSTQRHVVVNEHIWTFNFDKLEWSILSSLTMPRPTYFHAAAMNEVQIYIVLFTIIVFSFYSAR
jgi:hypothetical protein